MPLPPTPTFHSVANVDAVVIAKNVRFTVLTDRLIRLEYSDDNYFEDRPSQAFWHRDQPVPVFKKKITNNIIEIETEYLHLKYRATRSGFTPGLFPSPKNRLQLPGVTACPRPGI